MLDWWNCQVWLGANYTNLVQKVWISRSTSKTSLNSFFNKGFEQRFKETNATDFSLVQCFIHDLEGDSEKSVTINSNKGPSNGLITGHFLKNQFLQWSANVISKIFGARRRSSWFLCFDLVKRPNIWTVILAYCTEEPYQVLLDWY